MRLSPTHSMLATIPCPGLILEFVTNRFPPLRTCHSSASDAAIRLHSGDKIFINVKRLIYSRPAFFAGFILCSRLLIFMASPLASHSSTFTILIAGKAQEVLPAKAVFCFPTLIGELDSHLHNNCNSILFLFLPKPVRFAQLNHATKSYFKSIAHRSSRC